MHAAVDHGVNLWKWTTPPVPAELCKEEFTDSLLHSNSIVPHLPFMADPFFFHMSTSIRHTSLSVNTITVWFIGLFWDGVDYITVQVQVQVQEQCVRKLPN
jgi:hypothetical protein